MPKYQDSLLDTTYLGTYEKLTFQRRFRTKYLKRKPRKPTKWSANQIEWRHRVSYAIKQLNKMTSEALEQFTYDARNNLTTKVGYATKLLKAYPPDGYKYREEFDNADLTVFDYDTHKNLVNISGGYLIPPKALTKYKFDSKFVCLKQNYAYRLDVAWRQSDGYYFLLFGNENDAVGIRINKYENKSYWAYMQNGSLYTNGEIGYDFDATTFEIRWDGSYTYLKLIFYDTTFSKTFSFSIGRIEYLITRQDYDYEVFKINYIRRTQ